jgi:hypothetical protein
MEIKLGHDFSGIGAALVAVAMGLACVASDQGDKILDCAGDRVAVP